MPIKYPHTCDIYTRQTGASVPLDASGAPITTPDLTDVEPNHEGEPCRFVEDDSGDGMARDQMREIRERCGWIHLRASSLNKIARFDRVWVDNDFWSVTRIVVANKAGSGTTDHLEVRIETCR